MASIFMSNMVIYIFLFWVNTIMYIHIHIINKNNWLLDALWYRETTVIVFAFFTFTFSFPKIYLNIYFYIIWKYAYYIFIICRFNRLLRSSVARRWTFFRRQPPSLRIRGRSVSDAGLCSIADHGIWMT